MMTDRMEIEIELNRISQGYTSGGEGLKWFGNFAESSKRDILRVLVHMALQARARSEDVSIAIQQTGLKPTCTLFAMLARGAINIQLAKAVQLPQEELGRLFELLIRLMRPTV